MLTTTPGQKEKHVREYVSKTHFHCCSDLPTNSEVATDSLLTRASFCTRKVGGEECCLIREDEILAIAGGLYFPLRLISGPEGESVRSKGLSAM